MPPSPKEINDIDGSQSIKSKLSLEDAIIHTLVYSDLFDFPMSLTELHRYLFYHEISIDKLEKQLKESKTLSRLISHRDSFYCLKGREKLIELRKERRKKSRQLWRLAHYYVRVLSKIPFIKFIGITGSLAVGNIRNEKDDIDFFLITEKNRLWLAHAFLRVVALMLERFHGIKPCHNYIITEDQMTITDYSIYTARELIQMVPAHGKKHYEWLKKHNEWAFKIFPNSRRSISLHFLVNEQEQDKKLLSRVLECALRTPLGDILENLEWLRMRKKIMRNNFHGNEARYSKNVFKDHRNNHRNSIMWHFQKKLEMMYKQLEDSDAQED